MKGIVLAGGKGTRLGELTLVINKHLLPVGDVPMIYHPLKKLISAGITDIMLITGSDHAGMFMQLLESGKRLGCKLTYRVQEEAGGIAQAFGMAEEFVGQDRCYVILGDNIFQDDINPMKMLASMRLNDAILVCKKVGDPSRYGVIEYGENNKPIGIEEKPLHPKSKYAVTGIYSYPPNVFNIIRTLKPSDRGELEITDVNNHYLKLGRLSTLELDGWWTDAGTPESLNTANILVRLHK